MVQKSFWDSDCIPSHVYPEMGLLNHMIVLFFKFFWESSMLFFRMAIPFIFPLIRSRGFIFLYMLSLVILIIVILIDVRWYLIGVLICISLMICFFKDLFMYLLALYKSSLEKLSTQVLCLYLNHIIYVFVIEL